MIKVGLTGGIGSGKSTVASIFEELGVPIYNADFEAKEFLKNREVQNVLVNYFSEKVISDGKVDKSVLASIIFNDKQALLKVNNLIHPLVRQSFIDWAETYDSNPYVIIEVAILFENGFDTLVDKSIVVSAPYDQRLARTIKRDNTDENSVKSRMKNQWPQQELINRADFIIDNSDHKLLIPQVLEVDAALKNEV